MIKYKTEISETDWSKLADIYRRTPQLSLGKKDIGTIRAAFESSSKVATAWKGLQLIAAGRALSDGLCYASIFDVAVLPDFQKRGVGKGIVLELLQGYEQLNVYLTSTFGNEPFYAKLGFRRHKTAMARYPHDSEYLE